MDQRPGWKPGRLKQVPSREPMVLSPQNRKPEPWRGRCSLLFSKTPRPWSAVGSWAAMQILHQPPAHAAWDLRHAAAVEDLLNQYIKTLPHGATIPPPRLFIYKGTAFSRACPQSGIDAPAYCPGDHTIYLEMGLGDQVASKYGDFGALSILSHEFGHAYMSQRKLHPKGKEGELAADAFAGGFARYVEQKGLLEAGDVDEARATFASVGDYEVYHHDHHGTPAERRQAFEQGYQQGFRLPGEASAPPPSTSPAPPAQSPGIPPTEEQNPPPIAPLDNGGSPVIPLLGLGMGILLLILILVGVINMINRARMDD